jgi:hypothetical protein
MKIRPKNYNRPFFDEKSHGLHHHCEPLFLHDFVADEML